MVARRPRRYDLAVVGGGTAGLVAAIGAASQGAHTVMVERDRPGGDCLWTGCVPSKALLSVAERAHIARTSAPFGVRTGEVDVDFAVAMAHVRDAITRLSVHDSPQRLRDEGVELLRGDGRFTGPRTLQVGGREVAFRHAVLATGAAPSVPDLPGLRDSRPRTSDTIWELTELPRRLVVLGGGAIGCELGQGFARLGSEVTIVEAAPRLLPREEPLASRTVAEAFRREAIEVTVDARAVRVDTDGQGQRSLVIDDGSGERPVPYDELLVAVGRRPNVDGVGLDAAGVALTDQGAVACDDRLRTSNPRIWAAGDVTMRLPFTHVAATHGATIVQNALFGLRRTVDHGRLPWVTFTDPEVARVGLTAQEARDRLGDAARVRVAAHADLDRAVTAGRRDGSATLVGDGRGRIVGATVVGPRAGETIGEVVAWMAGGATLDRLARTTHAYPTWNEDVADASLAELRDRLARLAPAVRSLLLLRRWADRRR